MATRLQYAWDIAVKGEALAREVLRMREVQGWQPIATAPSHPMPVLFFFAELMFYDSDGNAIPPNPDSEPFRDERMWAGFWTGEEWRENGTGHNVFEDGRDGYWQPTHWMPLPAPPPEGET